MLGSNKLGECFVMSTTSVSGFPIIHSFFPTSTGTHTGFGKNDVWQWSCVFLMVAFGFLIKITTSANIPSSEMNALQDLYDATNGGNWKWQTPYGTRNGYPWNFTIVNGMYENPCTKSWQGISCLNYIHSDCSVLAVLDCGRCSDILFGKQV